MHVRYLLSVAWFVGFSGMSAHAGIDHLADYKMILSVQGKGSSLGFDAGTIATLYKNIKAMKDGKTIITGNSGGSILAVYFACHGFNDQSVANLNKIFLNPGPELRGAIQYLRETAENVEKKKQIMQRGVIPGIEPSRLDPFVKAALGLTDINQLPTHKCPAIVPFYIAAANYEVVHNIASHFQFSGVLNYVLSLGNEPLNIVGRNEKVFNPDTFEMSWRDDTFLQHQKFVNRVGLAKWQEGHPSLKLGDTKRIGKTCTAFVSPDVFELLRKLPTEERQCDLRLTDDGVGMATAIRASAAEPTYIEVIDEPNPEKLLVDGDNLGNLGNTVARKYWGGFGVPMQAQDLRRMLPMTRVIGTGWTRLKGFLAESLAALVLINSETVSKMTEYWADSTIQVDSVMASMLTAHTLEPDEEFKRGVQQTSMCLEKDLKYQVAARANPRTPKTFCLPESADVPDDIRSYASEFALLPAGVEFDRSEPLETGRGLGNLLSISPAQSPGVAAVKN